MGIIKHICFSRPRDRTQVSHIAGRRFNLWATREALHICLKSNNSSKLYHMIQQSHSGAYICGKP